jgi:hypothetical protein
MAASEKAHGLPIFHANGEARRRRVDSSRKASSRRWLAGALLRAGAPRFGT